MTGHDFKEFRKNFADNTFRAVCECGWSVEVDSHEDGRQKHASHYAFQKLKARKATGDILRCNDPIGCSRDGFCSCNPSEPQAEKVVDLSAKRWDDKTAPNEFSPREALAAILRDIDSGELKARHVIVVYATDEEDNGRTGFYQAGNIEGYFGSLGLLHRAMQVMGEG